MTILTLKLAKKQNPQPDVGDAVPEQFVGNMPIRLANCFELHGGAWVLPQLRKGEDPDTNLEGAIGIVQTHEKLRLVNKTSGHVMKI